MIATYLRWHFKACWVLIILMIPFFTLWIPLMPVYDWLNPWNEAVSALENEHKTGLRWMVGFRSESETRSGVTRFSRSRDFVMLPSSLTNFTVYQYSAGTGQETQLREESYGVFGYLLMSAACISFSWFVSWPKFKHWFRFPKYPPAVA